jgi:hypothetical protein
MTPSLTPGPPPLPQTSFQRPFFFTDHGPFDLTGERHVIILDVNPKIIENIFKQDQEIE